MSRSAPQAEALLATLRSTGPCRAAMLRTQGFSPSLLTRMVGDGRVERVARGVYAATDGPVDENLSLVEACARMPRAVACLLSALAFHGIGTQMPHQVWMGLPRGARAPKELRMTTIALPDWALTLEVETRALPSGTVRVTSPARTIVECFKHRRKVGLDVCLEALREGLAEHRVSPAQLLALADKFHVGAVLRPRLEALV